MTKNPLNYCNNVICSFNLYLDVLYTKIQLNFDAIDFYSGNASYRDTLRHVFGDGNTITSIQVPSRLDYLANQLPNKAYTSDILLCKHTILPYYLPFMDEDKKKQVLVYTKGDGGQKLHVMIGMAAGGICRKQELYYCPACVNKDVEKHGEAYFHRTHQMEGVFVCHKHKCLLKEYPVKLKQVSRIAFIRMDKDSVDFSLEYEKDNKLGYIFGIVAEQAHWLLNRNNNIINRKYIHDNIMVSLKEKGYLTRSGRVQQRFFCKEFHRYYGEKVLKAFESDFIVDDDYSWMRTMTRKLRKDIHPVRYILLANYLCGDISRLFDKKKWFNDKFCGSLIIP